MLINGAGFWHSPNGIQLTWGANFGPATQDGEWWRLGSAMFLHFGVVHLAINAWSLWESGQLVERMYGHLRFACIYLMSGLSGNLVSLVVHGNSAISGGASGAIFGVYGALLVFLWRERASIALREFRWLFWGALGFATVTIILGFIIPGIDNAAHIGGFLAGILASVIFTRSVTAKPLPIRVSISVAFGMVLVAVLLVANIPPPKYHWSDELVLRNQINDFIYQDQAINRAWLEIMQQGSQGNKTFDELAGQIDIAVTEPYEASFEKLSKLPTNPSLPSANQLESLLEYTQQRKEKSKALADKLRRQGSSE